MPPAIPTLREDLSLSLVTAGWVASLFNIGGALLGVLVGLSTDRLGARRVMLSCLAALTVGSLLGAFANGATWLLISRTLESLGFVGITVAGPRLIVAAADPRDHGLALSCWGTYMPAGFAIAMLIAPLFLATGGWRGLWLGLGLLSLAFMATMTLLTTPRRWPGVPLARRGVGLGDIGASLARPGPWLLGTVFAVYTIQWFAMMAWLPTFLIEVQGWTATAAAMGGALVVGINVTGNVMSGWLLHRGWPRWLLITMAYGTMLVCGVGVFADLVPTALKLPLAVIFSAVGGMLPGSVLAGASSHATSPAQVGTISGVIVQGANLGSLLGPPLLAVLVAAVGWQSSLWLFPMCGAVGIAMAVTLRRVEVRMADG